jgi:hypothetical protein
MVVVVERDASLKLEVESLVGTDHCHHYLLADRHRSQNLVPGYCSCRCLRRPSALPLKKMAAFLLCIRFSSESAFIVQTQLIYGAERVQPPFLEQVLFM